MRVPDCVKKYSIAPDRADDAAPRDRSPRRPRAAPSGGRSHRRTACPWGGSTCRPIALALAAAEADLRAVVEVPDDDAAARRRAGGASLPDLWERTGSAGSAAPRSRAARPRTMGSAVHVAGPCDRIGPTNRADARRRSDARTGDDARAPRPLRATSGLTSESRAGAEASTARRGAAEAEMTFAWMRDGLGETGAGESAADGGVSGAHLS